MDLRQKRSADLAFFTTAIIGAAQMEIRANAKVPGDLKSPGTFYIMVPKRGLEPRRPKALPPQDSVSTSFTTSAQNRLFRLSAALVRRLRRLCRRLAQQRPTL